MQTNHPSHAARFSDHEILAAYKEAGNSQRQAAFNLGLNRSCFRRKLARIQEQGLRLDPALFTITDQPTNLDKPLADLWEERLAAGKRVKEHVEHGRTFTIELHEPGPVGILHFGDPHLDDPGCDFDSFAADVQRVIDTPGLFAGVIGDLQNNWVGRLSRLYARQSVTVDESWRLVEEFLRRIGPKLVYLVAGNHDLWQGDGDPLHWIMRHHAAAYQPHGVRIRFNLPGGNQIRLSARHDWPGGSQFNNSFGQGKAAFRGLSDHIILSGHRHKSGYMTYYNANTGVLSHCIQVGAYKVLDDFADERGFPADNMTPSVMTIFDPAATSEAERVIVCQSSAQGVRVLTGLRKLSQGAA